MKVKEWIEMLQKLDQEKEMYIEDNETCALYDPYIPPRYNESEKCYYI